MEQTAVEWLIEQLENHNGVTRNGFEDCIQQAKQMEKEQIIRARQDIFHTGNLTAEQYYNETYIQTHTPKHYRVWFPDTMEAIGGYWWYAVTDSCGRLYNPKYPNEERDSVQWYIDNGYKIEEVING